MKLRGCQFQWPIRRPTECGDDWSLDKQLAGESNRHREAVESAFRAGSTLPVDNVTI
jgi:hypothetical protein